MSKKCLTQTTIKINNTYFDIVEKSFKVKKGYGTKENTNTIGEGNKINRYVTTNISSKVASGSFSIMNTLDNQALIDGFMDADDLTIEAIDVNGAYKPITNASIMNDPEWGSGADGVEIEFSGDALESA